jgi:hypothetical protein
MGFLSSIVMAHNLSRSRRLSKKPAGFLEVYYTPGKPKKATGKDSFHPMGQKVDFMLSRQTLCGKVSPFSEFCPLRDFVSQEDNASTVDLSWFIKLSKEEEDLL